MARPTVTKSEYTLVLGGSAGIGLAFAEWCASKSRRLMIVGRRKTKLRIVKKQLLKSGASEVVTINGDLEDPQFRSKLVSRLRERTVATLFIGGPSPPAGQASELDWRSMRRGCETCIVYPLHIVSSLLRHRSQRFDIILLSSSAAREPLSEHRFFLSASLRRTTEALLKTLIREGGAKGTTLSIWRPKVVNTDLARKYARRLVPCEHADTLENRLKQTFAVSRVPTPAEYVQRVVRARHD